jgi:hypothetical protein
MNASRVAVYAGGPLGPGEIQKNLPAVRSAGWTTVILGLFHVGRNEIPGQTDGDIIFNDLATVMSGTYVADPEWPGEVATLTEAPSTIGQIYASFGGGPPVEDYTTLARIYRENGNSFQGTNLEKNIVVFRKTFPAITGIDLDVEDTYDLQSLVAFCELLISQGLDITFCPYTDTYFWVKALSVVEEHSPGSVKCWNLQCYDGGYGNDPADWASAISSALPSFPTTGFIVAGDWTNDTPNQVTNLFAGFGSEPALGGGFIWNLDGILDGNFTMPDYVNAICQ